MLDRAAALLRPGGRMVYCTCSLEPEEGETQVAAFLRRQPDMRRVPIEPGEGIPAEFVTAGRRSAHAAVALARARTRDCRGLDGFFAARFARRG